MKRMISILLALSLCACSSTPESSVPETTAGEEAIKNYRVPAPMAYPDYTFSGTPTPTQLRETAVRAMKDLLSIQWCTPIEIAYYKTGPVDNKRFCHKPMKKALCMILAVLLLCSCTAPAQDTATSTQESTVQTTQALPPPDPIELLLDSMTTEELIGQMFLVRYPGDAAASEAISKYHIGSFLLFGKDFEANTPQGITAELSGLQALSRLPLIFAVDEEGGSVTRISCYKQYRRSRFPAPRKLYAEGGISALLDTEREKCQLLRSLGVNVNLAPVCDIATEKNAFMYSRSLRQSPQVTADIIAQTVQLMQQEQMGSVLKHFPGYGNNTDTHTAAATDTRSLQELESRDLLPFSAGIDAGCGAVLISHTVVSCFDSELPASLSPKVIGYLREQMGFDGVAVTDDLIMDAITDTYGAGEAAVLAVNAGNDLLCSSDYIVQYNAVLDAVTEGRISPAQIREAAERVLRWKQSIGLSVISDPQIADCHTSVCYS